MTAMALGIEPTAAKDLLEHLSVDLQRMPPEMVADLQRRTLEACERDTTRISAHDRMTQARELRKNPPSDKTTEELEDQYDFAKAEYRNVAKKVERAQKAKLYHEEYHNWAAMQIQAEFMARNSATTDVSQAIIRRLELEEVGAYGEV